MIKFRVKNNVLCVSNEDKPEFLSNLMDSETVAVILSNNNHASARELYYLLNNGTDYVVAVPEERFNKLNVGYGRDEFGKQVKIVMFYNVKGEVCFMSYKDGHIFRIYVQDGDVFSAEPLEEPKVVLTPGTKEYRSKMFSIANKLVNEHGIDRKEAFRLAKDVLKHSSDPIIFVSKDDEIEQDQNFEPEVTPEMKKLEDRLNKMMMDEDYSGIKLRDIFNKNPFEDCDFSNLSETTRQQIRDELKSVMQKLNKTAENSEVTDFLTAQFKKAIKLYDDFINGLNEIHGEINKIANKREKPINPNPTAVPWDLVMEAIKKIIGQ